MIALIPARAGSKRLPGKNTKTLGGKTLVKWTVDAAIDSGVFERIVLCSDTWDTLPAWQYQDLLFFQRADASDTQTDFEWMREVFSSPAKRYREFCILRPTSPFRSAETIKRAWAQWQESKDCLDSLRAVRPVTETPYKMWVSAAPKANMRDAYPMTPVIDLKRADGTPYHSSPTQTLPTVYLQTGALEMGWTRNVEQLGTISGRKIGLFYTDGAEAVDINTPEDFARAEALLSAYPALLQAVSLAPVSPDSQV